MTVSCIFALQAKEALIESLIIITLPRVYVFDFE
jgi:hypothetical protein